MKTIREHVECYQHITENLERIKTIMHASLMKCHQMQRKSVFCEQKWNIARKIWNIKFKGKVYIGIGSDLGLCGKFNNHIPPSLDFYIGNKFKKKDNWLGKFSKLSHFLYIVSFVKSKRLLPIFIFGKKQYDMSFSHEKLDSIIECDTNNIDLIYDIYFEYIYWLKSYEENTARVNKTQSIHENIEKLKKDALLNLLKARREAFVKESILSKNKLG